jgi:hypothetical protein
MAVDFKRLLKDEPPPDLVREVHDAAWADAGRQVYVRMADIEELVQVINRAGMKAKTVREMASYIRVYALTGAKP